jgi:GNAT superfamily N-acetyltransferase
MIRSEVDLRKLRIEKITEKHDVSCFDCSDEQLNEFLREDAIGYQRGKIAVTYLCYLENQLAGYYCLMNDSIELKGRPKKVLDKLGKRQRNYPAIKIGRLGVCKKYPRMGIGSEMVKIIVGQALSQSEEVGCRFITVDAYSKPQVLSFYRKNGFKILKKPVNDNVPMYLDILSPTSPT